MFDGRENFKRVLIRISIKSYLFFILIISSFSLLALSDRKIITFDFLLKEMTDKAALTYFPEPYYTLKQFSSYDRRTVSLNRKEWWANDDWTNFIREENNNGRREFVMFDADGPGAIVRFWMTFSGEGATEGILRIYLDNSKTPLIEGSPLKILSGHLLAPEPLSTSVSPETDYNKRGHNLYLPIPYSQHCKITYECNAIKITKDKRVPSIYYNINYRTYKKGTKVKSLTRDDLINSKQLIEKTAKTLLNPEISHVKEYTKYKILKPSDNLTMKIAEKGKAISKIRIKIDAKNINQALRSTVLEILFDGHKTVWVPIGDFFGTGYQIHPLKTWYTMVNEKGEMEASWLMPFKNISIINILNYGEQEVDVSLDVYLSDYKWKNSSMYFGAAWHEYNNLLTASDTNLNNDEWHFDLNYVNLKGQGRYVGDAITVFSPIDIWWGEGDEKIFVDGEDFPSSPGTGTEDYYGYAWCRYEKFSHPFIAQPIGAGDLGRGLTVNLRYRSLDAIPFRKKISSNIEMWDWAVTRLNYAMTAYWYAKPNFKTNVMPNIESVKKEVALRPRDILKPVVDDYGKVEGEVLKVILCESGHFNIGWNSNMSGKTMLSWKNIDIGGRLKTVFILKNSGRYKVTAYLAKGPDYGKIQISLNGKTIDKIIDCYKEGEIEVYPVELGIYDLKKGENTFSIKFLKNSNSTKKVNKVGIDYLLFKKINLSPSI